MSPRSCQDASPIISGEPVCDPPEESIVDMPQHQLIAVDPRLEVVGLHDHEGLPASVDRLVRPRGHRRSSTAPEVLFQATIFPAPTPSAEVGDGEARRGVTPSDAEPEEWPGDDSWCMSARRPGNARCNLLWVIGAWEIDGFVATP